MKQKTLPLLLVLPFVVGILSVLTIRFAVNIISEDLRDITWNYRQNEGFQKGTTTRLVATPLGSKEAINDPLNQLEWSLSSADEFEETEHFATLTENNNDYFINTHNTGIVFITVKNVRGTISRSFNAYIYETGVILINPQSSSAHGIEKDPYIGEYDYTDSGVAKARYGLEVETVPSSLMSELVIKDMPDGITFVNNMIRVQNVVDKIEYKELSFSVATLDVPDQKYRFAIVKDGHNVYNYNELLQATNATNPQIVVQQKHFESLENTYDANGNLLRPDTTLFGNYNFTTKRFSFDNEVYRFKTTYARKYLDDWNKANTTKLSDKVIAGIHVQKDYYGNGFKINGHNLTFPYEKTTNSEGVTIATLTAQNLFRGPLTFVALGNPTQTALINAYGQDNSLMYVDGDNITVRDVNLQNADFGNNLNNLNFTGTGIDINGNNNMLINSQVRNAKTTVRAFNGENITIKNSFISTARQFLLSVGSNEFITPRPDKMGPVYDANGGLINSAGTRFSIYFRYPEKPVTLGDLSNVTSTAADGLITNYLLSSYSSGLVKAIKALDDLMNQAELINDDDGNPIIKTKVNVEDSYFYQSGIASIALESMFNGPYLYNALPSIVSTMLENLIAGVRPDKVGGISYPSEVNLIGDTKFYDYKTTSSIDPSSLIEENISQMVNEMGYAEDATYTIDDIFPIRSLVDKTATSKGFTISEGEETVLKYVNIPIIYFGGGVNKSIVNTDQLDDAEYISPKTELDLLTDTLQNPTGDTITTVMQRSVLTATGFSPFYYHAYNNAYLYKTNPNIETLKGRS